jgi:pimeloyl-ACP methyl ester carboxylesterase
MLKIKTRTGMVAYEEKGSGIPVVLLHANPGDHRDFDGIVPALAKSYRTMAVDWPGYGESDFPLPASSATAMLMADVLEDFVEGTKLAPAAFIGNSIGGYAAARLAIRKPDRVRSLVLVSPGGFTAYTPMTRLFCRLKGNETITRLFAGLFAAFYIKRRNPLTDQILERTNAGRAVPERVAVDAAVWRSFLHPDHDLRRRVAQIKAPTLLVWGKRDPVLPQKADGRTAERSIPGARLSVLDTGHEPFAEDPEAFLSVVRPFLSQQEST